VQDGIERFCGFRILDKDRNCTDSCFHMCFLSRRNEKTAMPEGMAAVSHIRAGENAARILPSASRIVSASVKSHPHRKHGSRFGL
jgi:hypothetical protein